jgi:hypothetical protein
MSYLRDDKEQVSKLAEELRKHGAEVWMDVTDLVVGEPWEERVAEAIQLSEYFIACFSSKYRQRPTNGMSEELRYAIQLRQKAARGSCPEILPIKLDACDLPAIELDAHRSLTAIHWISVYGDDWSSGVNQLVAITLKVAKENARELLQDEAEKVARANFRMVWAEEGLATARQRAASHRRASLRPRTDEFEPPDLSEPTDNSGVVRDFTKLEEEHRCAVERYQKHQVEFVQKFGEEYHPLPELLGKMAETEEAIRSRFKESQKAEKARERRTIVWTHVVVLGLLALVTIIIVLL